MSGYLGAAMFVAATLLLMFWLMRGRILKEKFTLWWVLLAIGVTVFAVFPALLPWFSGILGIETPSNFVFFIASLMFLVLSVQFSVELSRADDRTRKLAEEIAILRAQVEGSHATPTDAPARPHGSDEPSNAEPTEDPQGGERG